MHVDGNLPEVPDNGFYYHYKHDPAVSVDNFAYEVLGVAHHTEDDVREEDMYIVIYRPLYREAFVYRNGKMFDARPLSMFMESVTKDGIEKKRFTKIKDASILEKLEIKKVEMYLNKDL